MQPRTAFARDALITTINTSETVSKRNFYNNLFNYVDRYSDVIAGEFEKGVIGDEKGLLPLLSGVLLSTKEAKTSPEAVLTKIHDERDNRVSSHSGRVAYLALYTSCAKELMRSPKIALSWQQDPEVTERIEAELTNLGRTLGTVNVEKATLELKGTEEKLEKKKKTSSTRLKFLSNVESLVSLIKKPFVKSENKAEPNF